MIRAKDLLKLLAARHSKDVFVPECKTGPSQNAASPCPRLDAWAMKRSWSNPHTYGYEIKVSRSDFLRDDKWHAYLPYCSHFAFVVAPGVCDPSEVPAECGLIVASKTGSMLFNKRRSPRREVEIPESLWRYVLMARSKITRDQMRYGTKEDAAAYWREWLETKQEHREIGRQVSAGLQSLVREKVEKVERESGRLARRQLELESVSLLLEKLGVSVGEWDRDEKLREIIEGNGRRVDRHLRSKAKRLAETAQSLADALCEEPAA